MLFAFGFFIVLPLPIFARTQINFQTKVKNPKNIVAVTPYLSGDNRFLFIDFETKDFKKLRAFISM